MNGPGKEEECLGKANRYLGKEMRKKGRKEDCRGEVRLQAPRESDPKDCFLEESHTVKGIP